FVVVFAERLGARAQRTERAQPPENLPCACFQLSLPVVSIVARGTRAARAAPPANPAGDTLPGFGSLCRARTANRPEGCSSAPKCASANRLIGRNAAALAHGFA